jgi:hypothetical protein
MSPSTRRHAADPNAPSLLSRRTVLRSVAAAVAGAALSPSAVTAGGIVIGGRGGQRVDPPYRIRAFRTTVLADARLPYTNYALEPLQPSYTRDAAGVIMYRWAGDGRLYYHPVQMAQKGLALVDNYRLTGIDAYLTRAKAIASRLRQESVAGRGGIYLPYRFPWVHGVALEAPWYSGMAQGLALSLSVRLHETTGRQSDLAAARLFYRTLTVYGRSVDPWVTYIDADRHLWFEEYPQVPSDHVLNGFVFAIYGIYDYYRLTRDLSVRRHLDGAMTTVRDRIADHRLPGGISYYCLGHRVQMALYHALHIRQLRVLAQISRAAYFSDMADLFAADHSGTTAATRRQLRQLLPEPKTADSP